MNAAREAADCYLQPGGLCCCTTPASITTLLGSCVSVTMFNPRCRIGAISHCLLPGCGTTGCRGDCADSSRYVSCAIYRMFGWFAAQGLRPADLELKLFGGADVMTPTNRLYPGIGEQNVVRALAVIDCFGVKATRIDVGGEVGRKIVFHSHTGEVFLKRLQGGSGSRSRVGGGVFPVPAAFFGIAGKQ